MKVSRFTRDALKVRRDMRDHLKDGWEFVSEGGGNLWQLYRGGRTNEKIIAVEISACGKAIWIKTAVVKYAPDSGSSDPDGVGQSDASAPQG